MTRIAGVISIATLLAVVLSGSWASASGTRTVPAPVRAAVLRDFPAMAWVPGRLADGYRFATWSHSKTKSHVGYQLDFVKSQDGKVVSQIAFEVLRRSCPAAPSWAGDGTFHINGHAIEWSSTNTSTHAWRCFKGARPFVIFGENGPVRMMAELVAYARPAK